MSNLKVVSSDPLKQVVVRGVECSDLVGCERRTNAPTCPEAPPPSLSGEREGTFLNTEGLDVEVCLRHEGIRGKVPS